MAAPPPSSSTLLLLCRSFLVAPGSSSSQTLLRQVAKKHHGRRTFCSSVRQGFEVERRDLLVGGRASLQGGGGGKVRRRRVVEESRRLKSETTVGKLEDDLERIPKEKSSDPSTLASTSTSSPPRHPRFTFPPSPHHPSPPPLHLHGPTSKIKELMREPDLFSPSFEPPKHTVVLCHGLYGYGVKGQIHYWANVQEVMKECGVDLLVVEVPSTGSIEERGVALHKTLEEQVPGKKINIVAHSMGGLDARYLITHIKDRSYDVLSLTSIATPHRGSPVMDWFSATLGLGSLVPALSDSLPPPTKIPPKFVTAYSPSSPLLAPLPKPTPPSSSDSSDPPPVASTSYLPSYLNPLPLIASLRATILQAVDSPAYYNLTTTYCTTQFNPSTPDDPDVKYFSIAARATRITPLLPLWYTQIVLDETAKGGNAEPDGYAGEKYEGNDGMVSVSSTKHGEWLGTVDDCNHWELRGGEGKLKTPPTPPSTEASSTSTETPSSSPSSSWAWSDLNGYLPSYEDISKKLFSPSTTASEGGGGAGGSTAGKSVEEGEKKLKSDSWAIMSLLGKLVPSFGGGGGSGGKAGSGDREEVDASAREKKEGTEEKFELARFYRAVILNLTRNGL
ncbi:Alpha/Beta hydrolase protein [Mrakia frigida]|uniref:esterase/lipase family protein n=1 Tax=Mrakia frigida TaxID=29902 RepID=UPI003FCC246D